MMQTTPKLASTFLAVLLLTIGFAVGAFCEWSVSAQSQTNTSTTVSAPCRMKPSGGSGGKHIDSSRQGGCCLPLDYFCPRQAPSPVSTPSEGATTNISQTFISNVGSPTVTPTPCRSDEGKTSHQTLKISADSLEMSGFPPWLNKIVLVLFLIYVIISIWLGLRVARKGISGNKGPVLVWVILSLVILLPAAFLWGTSRVTDRVKVQVEREKDKSLHERTPGAPLAPSELSAAAVSPTQVNLSWADNSVDEEQFVLERRLASSAYVRLAVLGPNATSYADSPLAPDTVASYRIRAHNSAGDSGLSNEISVTTPVDGGNKVAQNNAPWWFFYLILPVFMSLFLVLSLLYFQVRIRQLDSQIRETRRPLDS